MTDQKQRNHWKEAFITFGIIAVLAALNPGEGQFQECLAKRQKEISTSEGLVSGTIRNVFSESTASAQAAMSSRRNFILFSIYEVDGAVAYHRYLGICGTFIQLEHRSN